MKKLSMMLLVGVLALGPLAIGCSVSDDDENPNTSTSRETSDTFESGEQPLDATQSALNDALVDQLGSEAGELTPGGDAFVEHLTLALLYLLEGPDELLAAVESGDPDQLALAGTSLVENSTIFVDELLCAINSLAAENCMSLSAGGVPGEFENLETILIMLGAELDEGEGSDFDAIFQLFEDAATELEMALLDSESSFAGDPFAESLITLLAQFSHDNADLFAALGEEDSEAANDAFVAALDNLLENIVIGLPQLAEENPQLADQVENELQIVADAVNSYSIEVFAVLVDLLLDPVSDVLGGFGDV